MNGVASALEWKGYLKDGSGNNGTIKVAGVLFANEKGKVTGGRINMPVSSLININLPTDELKHQLVRHLQSPDFFHMAAYPEVSFQIKSLTPNPDLPGISLAAGELTILGKTNPVSFAVKINATGDRLEVTGDTSIDRKLWGITYASDENVANGMYVRPGIDVQFKLVANKY
ncbi:YceI family protein [Dyadobacter crusticola]|uniref:YceI family protein n=1 Tax=Dyadobacter crusticola TaxID=292407 RepID=UPI00069059D5|nr:YceI family protein [Dyadobacter crusticola]